MMRNCRAVKRGLSLKYVIVALLFLSIMPVGVSDGESATISYKVWVDETQVPLNGNDWKVAGMAEEGEEKNSSVAFNINIWSDGFDIMPRGITDFTSYPSVRISIKAEGTSGSEASGESSDTFSDAKNYDLTGRVVFLDTTRINGVIFLGNEQACNDYVNLNDDYEGGDEMSISHYLPPDGDPTLDNKCCGDDGILDIGTGSGKYICLYDTGKGGHEGTYKWFDSNLYAGDIFQATTKDRQFSYYVVAGNDGWYACDIDTQISLYNGTNPAPAAETAEFVEFAHAGKYSLYFIPREANWANIGNLGDYDAASVSLWFRTPDTDNGPQYLIDNRGLGGNWWLAMDYQNGTACTTRGNICIGGGGIGPVLEIPGTAVPNDFTSTMNWHHLVATMDSSQFKLYIDGNEYTSSTGFNPNLRNLILGKRFVPAPDWNEFNYGGYMDDLAIYNRVLSASEVADLFNNIIPENGRLAYWDFEEGKDSLAYRAFSNGAYFNGNRFYGERYGEGGIVEIAVGDPPYTYAFICSNNDKFNISKDTLQAAFIDGDDESWIACAGGTGSIPNSASTGTVVLTSKEDGGYDNIYFCDSDRDWIIDPDTRVADRDVDVCNLAGEGGDLDFGGRTFLDMEATYMKCCGDDFFSKNQPIFEYYNGQGSEYEGFLIPDSTGKPRVGGCWNNWKVGHGMFVDDVDSNFIINGSFKEFSPGDSNTYFINDNYQVNYWESGDTFNVYWDDIDGAIDGIHFNHGTNTHYTTEFPIHVTPNTPYEITLTGARVPDVFDASVKVQVLRSSDLSLITESDVFDLSGMTASDMVFEFEIPTNELIKIRILSVEGEFIISSISMKSKGDNNEHYVINYNGTFHMCENTFSINDYINDPFLVERDSMCSGYDLRNLGRGSWFCHPDGYYSNEVTYTDIGHTQETRGLVRDNMATAINLFENSGFELDMASTGTCTVYEAGDAEGRPNPKTTDDFRGHDYRDAWENTLYCSGSSSYSKSITLPMGGLVILSVWVQGYPTLELRDSGGSTVATDSFVADAGWERVSIGPVPLQGTITAILEGDAYFDDVQLEMVDESQTEPSKYYYNEKTVGCCPKKMCWTGSYCMEDIVTLQEKADGSDDLLFIGDVGKSCILGPGGIAAWDTGNRKYGWTDMYSHSGFCEEESQCYYSPTECFDSGESTGDFFCEGGYWTTKTKFIAAAMMQLAENRAFNQYSIICGPYDEVLNDFQYNVEYAGAQTTVENIILGGGTNVCKNEYSEDYTAFGAPLHYPPHCVNNICVMAAWNNPENKLIAVGTSLNTDIAPADTDDAFPYGFISALGKPSNYCSNLDAVAVPQPGFYACKGNDVFYDKNNSMVIYLDYASSFTDLEDYPSLYRLHPHRLFEGLAAHAYNLIYEPVHDIVDDVLQNPRTVITYTSKEENYELLSRINLFNNFYYHKDNNREMIAVKEIKYNHGPYGAIEPRITMTMDFLNTGYNEGEVCITFHNYERLNSQGYVVATNCTYVGDDYRLVAQDMYGSFGSVSGISTDVWNEFTSGLRFK